MLPCKAVLTLLVLTPRSWSSLSLKPAPGSVLEKLMVSTIIKKNEAAVERGKQIKDEINDAIKHHQSQINSMRSMLMELRRRGHAKENKITGKDYEFTISPIKDKLEISSSVDDWSADERSKYAMVKKTTTVTHCTDIAGNVLHTDQKVKTETIPNPDAIFNAHKEGQLLPQESKSYQTMQSNLESSWIKHHLVFKNLFTKNLNP